MVKKSQNRVFQLRIREDGLVHNAEVIAIVKKRLAITASLYEILQILSLTLFEKTQLLSLFQDTPTQNQDLEPSNQLNLFD